MKTKTLITALFLIIVSILYYFGICKWDIWVYLLCVLIAISAMMIFIRQQNKLNKLIDQEAKSNRK